MVFGSLRRISPEKRRCDLQYLCPRCRQTADSNGDSRLAQDQRKLNALGGQVLVGVLESGRKRKNGTPNREMQTQFQKALIPADIRSLATFDHKVFHRADWFDREDWRTYESWWMIIDNKKVGCCAFEQHVDFQDDVRDDGENPRLRGSLYIVSTGILPRFRSQGFGTLLKCWQICYARRHDFKRVVTHTRKSNRSMITLNRRFGFKILRTTPGYYEDPLEPTVVMELALDANER